MKQIITIQIFLIKNNGFNVKQNYTKSFKTKETEMEQNLLTIEEVKGYFKVKDTRTINKFIRQGLKYVPVRNQR